MAGLISCDALGATYCSQGVEGLISWDIEDVTQCSKGLRSSLFWDAQGACEFREAVAGSPSSSSTRCEGVALVSTSSPL